MPLYRFDAPPGHTLLVGSKEHPAGAEVELPEELAVDDRLTRIDSESEVKDDDVQDTESTDSSDEADTADPGPVDITDPEPEEEDAISFGKPRRASK